MSGSTWRRLSRAWHQCTLDGLMLLVLALLPLRSLGNGCWSSGFSAELCCDRRLGPRGNDVCWDGDFTYENCCELGFGEEERKEEHPLVPFAAELEPEIGVGLFPTYEPGKDCWTGSAASYAHCCDLRVSSLGNLYQCWDTWRYTFERCCFLGEAAPQAPAAKPWLAAGQLGSPAVTLAEEPQRPAGLECWHSGFTYAVCCLGGTDCWDQHFTKEGCCEGRPSLLQAWKPAEPSDPQVDCLLSARGLTLDLEQKPRQCAQRYVLLATLGQAMIGPRWQGQPWWARPHASQLLTPLRPHRLHFVGGLCVPRSCSVQAAASYVVPFVVPWWRTARPAPKVNATSALLPPPLAVPHKAYEHRAREGRFTMWTAVRPQQAEPLAELDRWDFAILEYQPRLTMSLAKTGLICLVIALNFLVSLVLPREVAADSFLAPQFHLNRLGLPRGPKHLEKWRLMLALVVLFIHVLDHGPWLPMATRSWGAQLLLLRSCLSRVNVGYVVLLVHLSISRRSLKQAASLLGWLKGVVCHAVRRWFVIAPALGFWSLVFVHAPFVEVPMNNILKSNPLFLWYGERRDLCEEPAHLLSSILLVHAPIMGWRSPCHNTDIFESLFQVDIAIFALLSALGRSRAAQVSHFLWVLAVALSYFQMNPSPEAAFNDTCHTFASLLPSALATLAVSSWLPGHELPLAPRGRLSWRGKALGLVAALCIGAACLEDGLLHCEVPWPPLLADVAARVQGLHRPNRDYVVPSHLYELLLVFGMVVHLKQGWLTSLQRQEQWSGLRFLGRLSTGICASNLFVLHLSGAFLHEEPVELTVYNCLAQFMMTFSASLLAATAVHFLVEGPFACMLSDGLPQDVSAFPAAAAAA